MFKENVEFRVTVRDFLDRCEPAVLKQAGSQFLRAVREASADYLENCLDPDAELRWSVTLHESLGVGTIHYVVYREGQGYEGKCLVWDLEKGPLPNRPWTPIIMKAGELLCNSIFPEDIEGVVQPKDQSFFNYCFRGWIPANQATPSMFEEDAVRTLIGIGFSMGLVTGASKHLMSLTRALDRVRVAQQSLITEEIGSDDPTPIKAARMYEVDVRSAKNTVSLQVKYLKLNETEKTQTEMIEVVIQEGGWLQGIFVRDTDAIQYTDIYTWLQHRGW
jgi:hypothetical protein